MDRRLMRIERAIFSVSDKTGIVQFARELDRGFDVEIISTGGTAETLQYAGVKVTAVADFTGFPEIFDGRVKTLHPKIHGGILLDPSDRKMCEEAEENGIVPIQLVVVNLYPFQQTIRKPGVTFDEAIEMIDIGGPAMIRAGAKNHRNVAVVISPESYTEILEEMQEFCGATSLATRKKLAFGVFNGTYQYDFAITSYLLDHLGQ